LKAIRFNSISHKIAAIVITVAVAAFAAVVAVRTIAGTSAAAVNEKEVADLLTELSPSDSQTHLAAAKLHEKAFDSGDLEIALKEYEKAARSSPNNYVLWLLLGSARTRAGDDEGAESAFLRAAELAPYYSRVQWALGNLFLRQGRNELAFEQLRKAVAGDPSLSGPAASTALLLADGDFEAVRESFKDSAETQVRLAIVLADTKRFDEARSVWDRIKIPKGSDRFNDAAKALGQKFFGEKMFRSAAKVLSDAELETPSPAVGAITNSGFELPVKTQNPGVFDWRVPAGSDPQFAVTNNQKRSGQFSLLALLNPSNPAAFQGFVQSVAVEPLKKYELSFAYKADVRTKAEYKLEVVSGVDAKSIASSDALLIATDWTDLKISFTTPAGVDGIEIRLARGQCSSSQCAANGSLWFDDIVLTPAK
jgi:hypothetical protein